MIAVPKRCHVCKKVVQVEVPEQGYAAWQAGQLIQVAMPEVSRGDRELLISGTCSSCFDKMFKPDS